MKGIGQSALHGPALSFCLYDESATRASDCSPSAQSYQGFAYIAAEGSQCHAGRDLKLSDVTSSH